MTSKEIKELSKKQLAGNWKIPVIITLAYTILSYLSSKILDNSSSLIGISLGFIILFSIEVWVTIGLPKFYLKLIERNGEVDFKDVLTTTSQIKKAFLYNIMVSLISFIFIILGICSITGIIVLKNYKGWESSIYSLAVMAIFSLLISIYIAFHFSISLVPYLIVEKEEIGVVEAIYTSMKMMKGNKTKLFILQISFIGWGILSLFTLGIGALWLGPYMLLSQANFYKDIDRIKQINTN